jgi:hypothetical protein
MGRLDFYQWLLFLAQHEERHSIQIRETAERLFNASDRHQPNSREENPCAKLPAC